ncbi:MAG: hypothetical protein ACPG4T_16765 [Nannocystaceae bacterium]
MFKTVSMIASLIAFSPSGVGPGNQSSIPSEVNLGGQWPVPSSTESSVPGARGAVEFTVNHNKTRMGYHYRVAETWLCDSNLACTPAPTSLHELAPAPIRIISRARDLPRLRARSGNRIGPRNEHAIAVYTPLNRFAQLAATNAATRRGGALAPGTVVAANRPEALHSVIGSTGAVWAIHVGVRFEICSGDVCNPCQPCPSPPPLPPIKGCPKCPPPRLGAITDIGLSFVAGLAAGSPSDTTQD